RGEREPVGGAVFGKPKEFGGGEGLERHPGDEALGVGPGQEGGGGVLIVARAEVKYPKGFATWIDVEASGGEADARPGHFRGVATICVKLLNLVRPDVAFFGQKDAMQAAVLRRVIRDLYIPVPPRTLPRDRDEDGLARSPRNVRLSREERERALSLPLALEGARSADDPVAAARAALNGLEPEYVELLRVGDATLLTAAARVGSTRLIDNVVVEGELGWSPARWSCPSSTQWSRAGGRATGWPPEPGREAAA